MALVVLQHFWMVMEEEAWGMHCSVLEPGLVVKLKKTRICQKMLNWVGISIPSSKIECCLLFISLIIHTKIRADWHYPSKRGDSLLTHTSNKTDTLNWSLPFYIPLGWLFIRGCLHDTGATFAPQRVHSSSLSWLYICLHDTTTNFMLAQVTPAWVHPGSCTGARISFRCEISQRYHVNTKQPQTTTRFGVKSVCR